jgi:hypothetical protein
MAPTQPQCTNAFRNLVLSSNASYDYYEDPYHVWWEKVFNWTGTISGPIADTFGNCSIALFTAGNFVIQ